MTDTKKETIYIDVDDEITSIIEKLQDSETKIVALVLPKRAAVLQSTVNMRLLKRAAQEDKKSVVLITSEAALLPLAGAVGLHVAKTLQSKPTIPPAPERKSTTLTITEDTDAGKPIDPKTPLEKLVSSDVPSPVEEETIDVDYDETKSGETGDEKPDKHKGDKKLKIPNFERFRLWIILGGVAGVFLIVFAIWALIIAPKARVTIKTDTSAVSSVLNLTASPSAKAVDKDKLIVPVSSKEAKKTESQKVVATGQKDNGTKAGGTMNLTNCIDDGQSHTVPSGTSFTSGQSTFVSTQDVVLEPALFSGPNCKSATFGLSKDVAVVSAQAGDKHNLSARSYTSSIAGISASGSAMTGGTSKLVKAVGQSDVDTAKQQLLEKTRGVAVAELNKQFTDVSAVPLSDGIGVSAQAVASTPNVGDEAEEVTVTLTVTYTMPGVAQSDLKQLIEDDVNQKIDPEKQQIQDKDAGLSKASIKLSEKKANGDLPFEIQVQVSAGPKLDEAAVKKEIIGKRKGQAIEAIKTRPGVKEVNIQYSPFWVMSTPKKASKITVLFEQANGSK